VSAKVQQLLIFQTTFVKKKFAAPGNVFKKAAVVCKSR
jgi:hypothetical protein